jgi:hypothetical protein
MDKDYCAELASELEEIAHRITVAANLPNCKRTQEMVDDTTTLFRAAYVLRCAAEGFDEDGGPDDEPD